MLSSANGLNVRTREAPGVTMRPVDPALSLKVWNPGVASCPQEDIDVSDQPHDSH